MATDNEIPKPIRAFLEKKAFRVKRQLPNKRFIVLKGNLANNNTQPLMLKIERGNPRHSINQRNLVLWTKAVQDTFPPDAQFGVAPILEDGFIDEKWHWFLMPFIAGEPFATVDEELTHISVKDPAELLTRIVALMHHIEKTTASNVASFDARAGFPHKLNKVQMLDTAIGWSRSDTPYLAELLQIINANYQHIGTTNSHGDFTETNLIITPDRRPILIDAEISNTQNYKYFDAAEFYNRLFTRADNPALAEAFLRAYTESLPKSTRKSFANNFLCLSALRCIGDFMEIGAFTDSPRKQRRIQATRHYAESIVSYDIVRQVQ